MKKNTRKKTNLRKKKILKKMKIIWRSKMRKTKNKPELTYPYKEVDPLNPPLPALISELEDVIKVENMIEYKDLYEIPGKNGCNGKNLFEKLANAQDKVDVKLKKELEEARIMPPNLHLCLKHYIRRMIKEKCRCYLIPAEAARDMRNAANDARGSGPVRGAVELRRWFEKTDEFFWNSERSEAIRKDLLQQQQVFVQYNNSKNENEQWNLNVNEYNNDAYTQRFNELALMCPRMVRAKKRMKKGDNQKGVIDEGFSDLEKTNNDDEHEIIEIFRTKTYEDYENELNNELDEPWSENGVPYEICDHIYEPFHFKNGKAKWPTCSSNNDGFCNGRELSGMLQDYWWKVNDHEYSPFTNWRDHIHRPYANYYCNAQDEEEQEDKGRCDLFNDTAQVLPVCEIKRFKMIKYSFGQEEEYVAIKEYEYDDLTRTKKDACHAYQEIFCNMDEGWLVTRAE
ncbi:hypothetical protein Tco_1360340 [Tanacetum coccineum]